MISSHIPGNREAISQTTFSNTIFMKISKLRISIWISLKFVRKGPFYNKSVLGEVTPWHRKGDKPLPDPMLTPGEGGGVEEMVQTTTRHSKDAGVNSGSVMTSCQPMMTSSNGNIFRVTGPLCGDFSPHKGQWRGALMFSLICAWINDWVNNRGAGDLRRHCNHYDVNVIAPYESYI